MLLPVTLGVPWWLERRSVLASGLMPPSAAPVDGTTTELAGSQWEIKGVVLDATGEFLDAPSDGQRLVDAVFTATPESAEAGERLEASCRFRAVDDRGRSWTPTTEYTSRSLPDGAVSGLNGCRGLELPELEAGTERGVVVSYLVPEDAVDSLRFEVRVDTRDDASEPEPEAALFDQPPE
ncbi:hypothetical protein FHX37_4028 [Haloactinospora alba]|uniref:DUF4352 domain-containing protein n=1 Tax=Haloactinospora alba TaxID=405555 RepID=A0A543NA24_9ACTN|nr:hypothetical protein FHX37_4028 [Haloactinospora alba]